MHTRFKKFGLILPLVFSSCITLSLLLLPNLLNASQKNCHLPNYYKKYTLSFGNPNAPVKIEKLFSFVCPSCLFFHQHHFPIIKEAFIDTGKVYWTLVPYVMDIETLYVMGVLPACSDSLKTKLFESILADSKNWKTATPKEDVSKSLKAVGLPDATIHRSFLKKHQEAVLNDSFNFKETRFVDGTPTFFMNREEIPGVPSATKLTQLINQKLQTKVKTQ